MSLPASFNQMTELQHLTIIDCNLLKSVDLHFAHWPKMTVVKSDFNLSGMIEKYPNIRFDEVPVMMDMD